MNDSASSDLRRLRLHLKDYDDALRGLSEHLRRFEHAVQSGTRSKIWNEIERLLQLEQEYQSARHQLLTDLIKLQRSRPPSESAAEPQRRRRRSS